MKHISLDAAAEDVKQFVRTLPLGGEGVELELDGQVICKVIPPQQLSSSEREAVLKAGWKRVRQAQQRNKGVSAKVIEREVDQAIEQVRRPSRKK